MWMERVHAAAGDRLEISYRGGPEVVSGLQLAEEVSNGAVDIGTLPLDYYPHLMPINNGLKLTPFRAHEERTNGVYDWANEQHQQQLGVYYLGKTQDNMPFLFWVNKRIEKPSDFAGLTMRTSPVYVALLQKLGASPVSIPSPEIYSALERNVVDGAGWAGVGPYTAGWTALTKYEIHPGIYNASTGILINLDKWNSIPADLQQVMIDAMIEVEKEIPAMYEEILAHEMKLRQEDHGVEVLEFTGADRELWLDLAYSAVWEELEGTAPDLVGELKQLFGAN